ncbi:MAG: hypothetical protein M0R80_18985 [Proteobacteria bacterium]|jgi:hypothetical protein|nr:hypothetical protein [Pseudomonadota bacterium]
MRRSLCAVALALSALAAARAGAAGPGDPDPRTPLVPVDRGRAPAPDELAAAAEGAGAPSLGLGELAAALRLADSGAAAEPDALRASHASAIEAFFAGDPGAAVERWTAIDAALAARPALMSRDPALRRVAFEARLYLALAARGSQDEAGVDRWLGAAAEIEELTPPTADFPPWVGEKLARQRATLPKPAGALAFEGAPGCELWIDGHRAGAGSGTYPVRPGLHAVHSRCGGRASLVREVVVGDHPIAIDLPTLRRCALERGEGPARLVAEDRSTDSEIADDVFSLARAAGAGRALAIVGRPGTTEIWIVDEAGVVRRSEAPARDPERIADSARRVTTDGDPPAPDRGAPEPKRLWYRDGTAWALVASGLAIWGTGLALGRTYGSPSPEESAAWAMMAGGAFAAGTGVVLFFVPKATRAGDPDAEAEAVVGATASWRF